MVKDLGGMMNDNANFDDHIRKVCVKVRNTMRWIRRCFSNRHHDFLTFMWQTFCQPHLDFASQNWSPTQSPNLENLEGLLRTYTTWFPGTEGLNYWE